MATSKPRTLPITKRGLNFEMFMWLFTRLSALGMYALILFAIMGALWMGARNDMNLADVMRWGFMPTNTHVQSTDVPDLAPWSSPFWRLTASALLLLAVALTAHRPLSMRESGVVFGSTRSFRRSRRQAYR